MASGSTLAQGAQSVRTPVVVAIPTLNEEASIGDVVASIPRDVVTRIIVADGGSCDGTTEQARNAGADVISVGKGYGRACLTATEVAGEGAIIVFMDGDGADDAATIPSLVAPIQTGDYDFVIGSRVRGAHESGSLAWHQILAGLIAGRAIQLLYGVSYTDMCAFRAIRREVLLRLGMREMSYGWNIEMQMRSARASLRILELPVPYHRRIGGHSKVAGNLSGTVRAGLRIITTFGRVAMQRAPDLRKA
jgi:glycosyltransferase involved in cell wall biosynthesis